MKQAPDITDQDKADFLEQVLNGDDNQAAAESIGTTASVMRKFWSGNSERYFDPEFAQALEAAENSPIRHRAARERVEAAYWKQVDRGEWRAIEKGLYAFSPAFAELRHQNLKVTGTIDHKHLLERVVAMSDDELKAELEKAEAREAVEQRAIALLPPADAA